MTLDLASMRIQAMAGMPIHGWDVLPLLDELERLQALEAEFAAEQADLTRQVAVITQERDRERNHADALLVKGRALQRELTRSEEQGRSASRELEVARARERAIAQGGQPPERP